MEAIIQWMLLVAALGAAIAAIESYTGSMK